MFALFMVIIPVFAAVGLSYCYKKFSHEDCLALTFLAMMLYGVLCAGTAITMIQNDWACTAYEKNAKIIAHKYNEPRCIRFEKIVRK